MAHSPTVGDYVTLQRGTTYKGNLVGKPGPALLGLGAICPGGGFRNGDYKTYGGNCPPKLMLVPGDLFVSLKGATKDGKMIGSVARVPSSVPSGRLTQDTVKLQFHDASADKKNFIYWLLRTPQYRDYCAGRATGSAVVALSREDFLSYPVPAPNENRMAIVGLLEDLDDKIELNRTTNETLEEMARAVFKSWFVDFDPVVAKSEGRKPEGMDAETARLFPSSFVDSEIGRVPKGWRVARIGDCVTAVGGTTPSTSNPSYWDGTHCFCTPKDLSALSAPVLLGTERRITDHGLEQIGSGLLPTGSVLLSSRAPIGYLVVTEVPTAINQGFIAMICDGALPNHFVLRWAEANMDVIKGRANGTTFMEISKSAFRPIELVVPPPDALAAYIEVAMALHARVVSNLKEDSELATARDALLPRLLSGDLRLPQEARPK